LDLKILRSCKAGAGGQEKEEEEEEEEEEFSQLKLLKSRPGALETNRV
jgi:hypothetical protein